MISKRKQWIKILFMTSFVCLCFSCTTIFAFNASDLHLVTTEVTQVKDIISRYCEAVLSSQPFVEGTFAYNAKQSAFVHLLCKDMGYTSSHLEGKNYFKRETYKNLGFKDGGLDAAGDYINFCDISAFQNDCDIAINVPKLFNGIMNDYVNMKQPNLYGLKTEFTKEDDIKNQINIYFSPYFDGVQICGSNETRYPKTCKMIQGYFKSVRNILSEVNIFSTSGVFAAFKQKDKVTCPAGLNGDIFYCGLYGDQGASLVSFVNLVYNELFYYRLFMGYYLTMLQKYPQLLNRNEYITNYASVFQTFSTQYVWSNDALNTSLGMLRDIYMAFPFHVGFSMYQEDLDGFAKQLARIAPPIYTLYDKLRNVQKPE